jgi:hypothetical protein
LLGKAAVVEGFVLAVLLLRNGLAVEVNFAAADQHNHMC